MLVVLAIAAAAAYYVWKGVSGEDAAPTCAAVNTACLAKCRKSATEAPAMQACQEECRRDLAACSSK
jgi:hypothetical protein